MGLVLIVDILSSTFFLLFKLYCSSFNSCSSFKRCILCFSNSSSSGTFLSNVILTKNFPSFDTSVSSYLSVLVFKFSISFF